MPMSLLAAHTQGLQYVTEIPHDLVLFDIETDREGHFIHSGCMNWDGSNFEIIRTVSQTVERLLEHSAHMSYNGFRFDMRSLSRSEQ